MSRAAAMCVALAVLAAAAFLLIRGSAPVKGSGGGAEDQVPPAGAGEATARTAPDPLVPVPYGDRDSTAPAAVAAQPAVRGMLPAGVLVSRRSSTSGRISGTWTLPGGDPAAGHPVLLYPEDGAGGTRGQILARTGSAGMYEAHAEPGPYLVAFGDARLRAEVPPGGDVVLDYAAPDGGDVSVRLAGPGGTSNALVSLVVRPARSGGAVQEMLARTGPGGVARFAGVPAGKAEATASMPRRGGGTPIYATTAFATPGQDAIEVELRASSASLDVLVVDGAGRALPGAAVEVWSRLHRGSPDVRTAGPDGRVVFANLVPGRAKVRASMSGHAARLVEFPAEEGGARHRLVLPRGRRLPVRAALVTGEPMQIVLRALAHHDPPPGRLWEARTGEDGRGEIEDLPAEGVVLRFVAAGCREVVMEIPAGAASAEVLFERVAR